MTPLAACPHCSRHVRIDEVRCPFCAVGLEGAFDHRPALRSVVGRFSRAAILALGTSAATAGTVVGCSDDSDTTVSPPPAVLYGAPPSDAGTDSGDAGANGALYGAPPGQR